MKAIKEIDDTALCIHRKKWARGFKYIDEKGTTIKDQKKLKRLKNLVIPPMWEDVKICMFEEGHRKAENNTYTIQSMNKNAKKRNSIKW